MDEFSIYRHILCEKATFTLIAAPVSITMAQAGRIAAELESAMAATKLVGSKGTVGGAAGRGISLHALA
jgi:hypothetical protein